MSYAKVTGNQQHSNIGTQTTYSHNPHNSQNNRAHNHSNQISHGTQRGHTASTNNMTEHPHSQQNHQQSATQNNHVSVTSNSTRNNIQSGTQYIPQENPSSQSTSTQSTLPLQPTSKQFINTQTSQINHQSNAQTSSYQIGQQQNTQIDGQRNQSISQSSSRSTQPKPPISSNESLIMYYGTKYEIKCGETFAYYEGYVVDYDVTQRTFQVMYGWKPTQYVTANFIRPLAPPKDNWWRPKLFEQIECEAKAEENDPFGWWSCTVQNITNNLYKIAYDGWETHTDMMSLELLRPKNTQPNFIDRGLTRQSMKLSEKQITWICASSDQLALISAKTNLIHLGYRPDIRQLVIIGLKSQVDDAVALLKHIWDIQQQYADQEKEWIEEEQKCQSYFDKLSKCYRLSFTFDSALTGFVIGKNGTNIVEAKKISGVEHINIKDLENGLTECSILAKEQEVAEDVREQLELEMAIERIPKSVLYDIIGAEGKNISDLEEKVAVSLICTMDHYETKIKHNDSYESKNDNNEVEMVIIGPKINIPVARSALQSEVKTANQKKDYRYRSKSALYQLKQFQKDDVSTQYDYKKKNNNDKTYSKDYNQSQDKNEYSYHQDETLEYDDNGDIIEDYDENGDNYEHHHEIDHNFDLYGEMMNNQQNEEYSNNQSTTYGHYQRLKRGKSHNNSGYQQGNYRPQRQHGHQRSSTNKKIYVKKQSLETGATNA